MCSNYSEPLDSIEPGLGAADQSLGGQGDSSVKRKPHPVSGGHKVPEDISVDIERTVRQLERKLEEEELEGGGRDFTDVGRERAVVPEVAEELSSG